MQKHLQDQLDDLKQHVQKMASIVQYAIESAVYAYLKRNPEFAEQVFEKERMINQLEIEIDDIGHSLLALGQPVAAELRLLTTILKVNTTLERMGDHAVNIAERVLRLIEIPESLQIETRLADMALEVQGILKEAVEAFVREDAVLAQVVLRRDDRVDSYNDNLAFEVERLMESRSELIRTGMQLVRMGHDLERIADLANNIAEDVLYMKQGKEVRHRIAPSS